MTTEVQKLRPNLWEWSNREKGGAIHSGGYCRTKRDALNDADIAKTRGQWVAVISTPNETVEENLQTMERRIVPRTQKED